MDMTALVSTTTSSAQPTGAVARRSLQASGVTMPSARERIALSGSDELVLAALALHVISLGHQLVLVPWSIDSPEDRWPLRAGHRLHVTSGGIEHFQSPLRTRVSGTWDVAMYTSGSTGKSRAFGFTRDQLNTVASWYIHNYGLTSNSGILTSLPVTYNFTFVAGLYLAAVTGACLHLSRSPDVTFQDVVRLAPLMDRCVVLANPVLLQLADHTTGLPGNAVIDSGGAPLSTPSVAFLRKVVGDVREGYGLTETASLTHFDTEGTTESLGTVGTCVPGVRAWITETDGRPRLGLKSPTVGVEVFADGSAGPARTSLVTSDLACIDQQGRLRVLGRADDWCIGGFWPRDTLDLIGVAIGVRCALVRHPAIDEVHIRVLGNVTSNMADSVRSLVSRRLELRIEKIDIDGAVSQLLHSHKLPRSPSRNTT
jgi:hypothetical protein